MSREELLGIFCTSCKGNIHKKEGKLCIMVRKVVPHGARRGPRYSGKKFELVRAAIEATDPPNAPSQEE